MNQGVFYRSIHHVKHKTQHLHTLDISQYEADDLNRQSNRQSAINGAYSKDHLPKRSKSIMVAVFVFLSVAIHVVVILLLIVLHQQNRVPEAGLQNQVSVNSYLIVKPVLPKVPVADTTELELPEKQAAMAPSSERVLEEPAAIPVQSDIPQNAVEPTTELPQQSAQKSTPEQVLEPKSIPTTEPIPLTPSDSIILNGTGSERRITTEPFSSSALRNYQSQRDSQAVNRMAQEQARAFREQQTSPIIDPPDLPTPEEREATLRKREVDCTNLAKKALRMATALSGGTVECRKHADFQQFIDKHKNKGIEDEK